MRAVTFLASVLLLTSCGDDLPTAPEPGTPPTQKTVMFDGTVNQNGARTHTLVTESAGLVTVTLTTLSPTSDQIVGLSLGTFNGSACQLVITKDDATQGSAVVGQVSTLGSICVRIYDVGNIPASQPSEYVITVTHY